MPTRRASNRVALTQQHIRCAFAAFVVYYRARGGVAGRGAVGECGGVVGRGGEGVGFALGGGHCGCGGWDGFVEELGAGELRGWACAEVRVVVRGSEIA